MPRRVFAAALALNFLRLARGPSTADRILALDTLYVNALALLILGGVLNDTVLYFEAALIISASGLHRHGRDGEVPPARKDRE